MDELFLIFILFSFLGWLIEVIYAYYKHHEFVNRGFLAGPFCPIYGIGVVMLYVTVYHVLDQSSLTGAKLLIGIFLLSAAVTTLIEWIVGSLLYYFFQTRWWDYSNQKFNVRGYICFKFSIYWGIIGTLVIYSLLPMSLLMIRNLSEKTIEWLIIFFLVGFVIDASLTMRSLVDFRRLLFELENEAKNLRQSKLRLTNEMRDSFDLFKKSIEKLDALQSYYSSEIKEIINDLIENDKVISFRTKFNLLDNQKKYEQLIKKLRYSRFFKAFPDMTSRRFADLLKELRRR